MKFYFWRGHDTVGAVAIDSDGNVACATSTGGITRQVVGRVSDSCLVGSGGFADNEIGSNNNILHFIFYNILIKMVCAKCLVFL